MDKTPTGSINYECKSKNKCSYSIEIKQNNLRIDILVQDKSSVMDGKYKISLSLEELVKLNKYYRQFDTIDEVYQDFSGIENIDKLTSIEIDKDFLKFDLVIPFIQKRNPKNYIEVMMKGEKISENEVLFKLCEKVKEIDVLKRKIDYIFYLLGKTEKDFDAYEQIKELIPDLTEKIENSKVVQSNDFIFVQEGILKKLKKKLKDIKLLYRASRDKDSSSTFHSKCDGIPNTVTFIKARNGRKFGGFSEKAWNTNGGYYVDNNTFLFSLDSKEHYFYNGGNCMYGNSSYGPFWGPGHDLYISNNCLSNNSGSNQSASFDYYGRTNCLSGNTSFQTEDYEVYQLTLE